MFSDFPAKYAGLISELLRSNRHMGIYYRSALQLKLFSKSCKLSINLITSETAIDLVNSENIVEAIISESRDLSTTDWIVDKPGSWKSG